MPDLMPNALQRIADHWRDFGFRGLHLRFLAGLSLYREMPVYLLDFALHPPDLQARIPVEVSQLQPAEAKEYGAVDHSAPGSAAALWAQGANCFVARHRGQIVSSVWAAERSVHLTYVDRALEISTEEVYFLEAFTTAEFRGQGLLGEVLSFACRHYRAQGRRRAYTVVFRYNRPSAAGFAKAGFRLHSIEGFRQFGPWRRSFTRLAG